MAVQDEIRRINERNVRVEADKAWETSTARKLIIAAMTYVFAVIFLVLISAPSPFLNALVPVLGFWMSTLTLPIFKGWWLKQRKK